MNPRLLLVALQLLTRLPVGEPWREPRDTARSVGWFAVAGAMVGGVAAFTWWISALALPRFSAAVLTIGVLVLLTGGLHEDGAADTADGFFGGDTPTRRLEIMRDSRVGTYGVLALVMSLLLRVSLLASLPPIGGAAALVAVIAVSRGVLGTAMLGAAPAAGDGQGLTLLDDLRPGPAIGSLLVGALAAGLAVGWMAVAVVVLSLAAAVGVRHLGTRRIGGLTGDVMGAMILTAEVVGLLTVAVASGDLLT
ncbi:adenosylcobinamide-GDP ribazoletransferase [soil metagenome]